MVDQNDRGGDPWILVVFGGFCGCRGSVGVTAFWFWRVGTYSVVVHPLNQNILSPLF